METNRRHHGDDSRLRRPRNPNPPPSPPSSTWGPRRPNQSEPAGRGRENTFPNSSTDEQISPIAGAFVGTCPDMCPEKERAQRERLRDLSVFERFNGNPCRTSPNLAVKKFCRTMTAIHLQTSDIRPLPVLQRTLDYLLGLIESSTYPFEVVHDFIFDRTRSIRQDLSVQQVINDQAIEMYEKMVKFHIVSHQKLASCSSKPDVSSLYYLNMEQLLKCLLTLFDMYDIGRKSKCINKNEGEFYSFYALLHLGCKIPTMDNSLSSWLRKVPFLILRSKEMSLARTLSRYSRIGNYMRFFSTLAAEASHLQLCLIEPFLNEVRAKALSYINFSGYKPHPYPLKHLSKLLMIKEQELESICYACGLQIYTDETGCKLLPAKQTSFCFPKAPLPSFGLQISNG